MIVSGQDVCRFALRLTTKNHMTIIKSCPYCDARFPGRDDICFDCREHFKGIFLCRAEKLTYEQKVSLGRYIMYLKKKDDEKKQQLSNPAMIYKGLKPKRDPNAD